MVVLRLLHSNHGVEIAMLLPKTTPCSKTTQKQHPALLQRLLDAGMERVLCLLDIVLPSLVVLSQIRFVVHPGNAELTHTSMLWSRLLDRFLEVGSMKRSTIRS